MLKNIFPVYYHWACFEESELNSIFHWRTYWGALRRSSLSAFVVSLGWQTTEKSDVSFLKSLTFEFKPLGKSFIYIENNKFPRIEPCGTPGLTCDSMMTAQRETPWYRLLKKEF